MAFDQKIADDMYQRASMQLQGNIEKCTPETTKTVAIIGGQPGAGKSSITKMLESKYSNNIVSLNGDDFKELYPQYSKLLAQNPDKTSDTVQPYSNYVVDRLKEDMIAKGLNVMVEGTMRNPETPLKTADQFIQNGYKAEAHVVSVNEHASHASCIERYERDVSNSGSGRSVKLESHNEAYSKIPETLQALVKSEQLSDIVVYDRTGKELASLSKGDDIVQKYVENREKITPELVTQVSKSIQNSAHLKQLRNAPQSEFAELHKIQASITHAFSQQQENTTLKLDKNSTIDNVLTFFEKSAPDIVNTIRENNTIDYKRHTIKLEHANPKFVAEQINEKANTGIKIELDKNLEKSRGFER